MKVGIRWVIGCAMSAAMVTACSDSQPLSPDSVAGIPRANFDAGALGAVVTFHPGATSDPGATGTSSIPSVENASQGLAFKVRLRGDVFANLQPWDSRTLLAIGNANFGDRKVELVAERNDRSEVRLIANWSGGTMLQTAFVALSSLSVTGDYVLYGHYNDAASPQRELAWFDGTGAEVQRAVAAYSAGPLSTAAGSGTVSIARGLHNWSANGTFDGVAVYVMPGTPGLLAGSARWSPPLSTDAGIVSLVTFDEGSGTTAGNRVAGAPGMALQNPSWISGGVWNGSSTTSDTSAPPVTGSSGSGGTARFAPGNSSIAGAVTNGSVGAIEAARQGLAVKLRVKGDAFTALRTWDSRTLLSISDGTFAGRKLELVIERDSQDHLNVHANWPRQIVSLSSAIGSFDPSRYYVIYVRYDDRASPQRELAIFDDSGVPIQQVSQFYAVGDLPTNAGSGIVSLATGLSNWSANGTIDGVAIYVLADPSLLAGPARYSRPSALDPGIATLVTFDESSGSLAANSVAGAPAMTVPGNVWAAGGDWISSASPSLPVPSPSPVQSAPAPAEAPGTIFFADDFSSGDLSRTTNGWSWTDATYVDVIRGFSKDGNVGNAARFTFPAATSTSPDAWSELRFRIGNANVTDLWITFWLYYPSGQESVYRGPRFIHRPNPSGSSSNNKFFRLYNTYATGYLKYGAETWSSGAFGDGDLIPEAMSQAIPDGEHYWDVHPPEEIDANRGRWQKIEIHCRAASSAGAADGIIQVFRDGLAIVDLRSLNTYPSLGENYFKAGYLMGWANSGFASTSYVYVSNVSFSSSRMN